MAAVTAVANQVLGSLAAEGRRFYGVHLRIEQDWVSFGREGQLQPYIELMDAAGFTNRSSVYIASGIFSYQNSTEIQRLEEQLQAEGVCGAMHFKERLLSDAVLAGLHSEQRALVDLIVLSKAGRVVGSLPSTLSWYARELRALEGLTKESFHMIGSDETWAQYNGAGVLVFAP